MSIDRLIHCACGHSVDLHEADGCRHLVRRVAAPALSCACPLSRDAAIDRVVDEERIAIRDRWRSFESRSA